MNLLELKKVIKEMAKVAGWIVLACNEIIKYIGG